MLVGYARTSTVEQEAGYAAQIAELERYGCEEIFAEKASATGRRPKFDEAMRFVRKKDVLVITKLDRLVRSVRDMLKVIDELDKRGASLRILSLDLDTSTSSGKLILTVMGGIAQFERDVMLERQREGIAKAKADGKYKGRRPTAREKTEEIITLACIGLTQGNIAKRLGISRASVHRIVKANSDRVSTGNLSLIEMRLREGA